MEPGKPTLRNYKYIRRSIASSFVIQTLLEGKSGIHICLDERGTAADYARALEYIAEVMFPDAEKIVLVENNLNTHGGASL